MNVGLLQPIALESRRDRKIPPTTVGEYNRSGVREACVVHEAGRSQRAEGFPRDGRRHTAAA